MNKKVSLMIDVPFLFISWFFLAIFVLISGLKLIKPDFILYSLLFFVLTLNITGFLLSLTRRYLRWINNVDIGQVYAKSTLAYFSLVALVLAFFSAAGLFYYLSGISDAMEVGDAWVVVSFLKTWMLLLVVGIVFSLWSISYLWKHDKLAVICGLCHVLLLFVWWLLYDGL